MCILSMIGKDRVTRKATPSLQVSIPLPGAGLAPFAVQCILYSDMRLSDVPREMAEGWRNTPLPEFASTPWTSAPELKTARLAIVTTAGLHRRSDQNFVGGATDYRIIPGDVDVNELVQSHVSVNFDRTAFQQDTNAVFPLDHLRAMTRQGEIGSLGAWHYSFMGATDPTRLVEAGKQVAGLLKADGVQCAILVPV